MVVSTTGATDDLGRGLAAALAGGVGALREPVGA